MMEFIIGATCFFVAVLFVRWLIKKKEVTSTTTSNPTVTNSNPTNSRNINSNPAAVRAYREVEEEDIVEEIIEEGLLDLGVSSILPVAESIADDIAVKEPEKVTPAEVEW